jgi:hypothetical protein
MVNRATWAGAVVVIATLAAGGCSPDTVLVESPEDSLPVTIIADESLQRALELTPTETLRIHGVDHGLSYLVGVGATDDVIVTVDQILNRIMVFDRRGSLVSSIGGNGDGPGELRRPSSLAVFGDTIYVIYRNGLSLFLTNGEFLRRSVINSQAAGGTSRSFPYPQSLAHDGTGLVTSFMSISRRRSYPSSDTISLHRLGYDGVAAPPFGYVVTEHEYKMSGGMYGPPLFMGRPNFAVSGTGAIFVTHQSGVDINVLTSARRHSRIHLAIPRREVSSAEIDTMIALVARNPLSDMDERGNRARLKGYKTSPVSRYRSAIGRVVSGPDGLVMYRREDMSPIDVTSVQPVTWEIVSVIGEVVGRVRLARALQPYYVSSERIVGIQTDSNDVPSVVVLSIQSAVR